MKQRSRKGSLIAEYPGILFLLFIGLTFPLLNLATITIRYCFLVMAAHEAAYQAALAKTFLNDVSATDRSAINVSNAVAQSVATSFDGVKVTNINTRIAVSDVATQLVTRTATKLLIPADTSKFVYMIESELNAEVQPFMTLPVFFSNIPGLTGPMIISVCARKVCENPQGLNK